jgi:polyribonucleotide nucleotidyltransferase
MGTYRNVSDVVNMGDVFQVKYLGMDPKTRKKKSVKKSTYAKTST